MLITGLILSILLGLAILLNISQQLSRTELLGLSFPAGIGAQTIIMVCLDFAGIRLTATTVVAVSVLLLAGLCLRLYLRRKTLREWRASLFVVKSPKITWLWLVIMLALTTVSVMNMAKIMYYPTFDRDSVVGFNLTGIAVAHEGTIKGLSLYNDVNYEPHDLDLYKTYTPLSQLGYAYVYMLGAETSKSFNALIFISMLFAFYGVTRRFTTHTLAALTTFMMIITPEMLGFSSLSGTNFTHAVYASLGLLFFAAWYYGKNASLLWISALLLMLNVWTRNEGLAFIGAACCLLCRHSLRIKQYKTLILFTFLCLLPFVFWNVFLKINHMEIKQLIIFKPYWDAAKAGILWREMWALFTSPAYYGVIFIVFPLIAVSNLRHIIRHGDQLVTLLLILLAWIFYTVLVYQIDYIWDTLENVMRYSYKRFLFSFMPLLWFYVAAGKNIRIIFEKIDDFVFQPNTKSKK
ncbi:MAG: hypothetical protein LBD59_04350 [Prevotellaceae bacterium]|jgi:hypothetical protein|nr:hypothetical protein [Prevotellaceae bacterium]